MTQTPVGVIIILELNRPLYPGQGGGSPAFLAADRALGRSKQLGPDHTETTRG